jgi:tetratricopeptide (TPR) repeat protein
MSEKSGGGQALRELFAAGQTRKAREEAEKILRQKPDDAQALVALAKAHLVEGEIPEAQKAVERAEQAGGETLDSLTVRAALATEAYELDRAVELYQRVAKGDPKRAEAEYGLGIVLAEQRRFADSLPHFERAVKLSPKAGVLHYHLAQNLIRLDQHKRAVEHLEKAVTLNPLYPPAYQLLAKILCIVQRPADAKELLMQGLKLMPQDSRLRAELTNVQLVMQDTAGAAATAGQLAEDMPDDVMAQENHVVTLLGGGRLTDAVEKVRELEKRGLRSASLKMSEGMALQGMDPPDVEGAIRAYEAAMSLDAEDWKAPCNLGLLLMQKGQPPERAVARAVTVLTEAMRRAPDRPEVLLNLALAYVRQNNRPKALELAQKVVALKLPDGDPAREQAERLVKKLKPAGS